MDDVVLLSVIGVAVIVVGWLVLAVAGSLLVGGAVRLRDARRTAPRRAAVVVVRR